VQMPYAIQGTKRLPSYWGNWFVPIADSGMQRTELNVFYQMGHALGYLVGGNCRTGQEIGELALNLTFPREWIATFIADTASYSHYLRESRNAAQNLLGLMNSIHNPTRFQAGHPVTQDECTRLFSCKEHFEQCFERESRKLYVFTVTPKGTRDTAILVESPEDDFTDTQKNILPDQYKYDLKQAARCLVFDIPTACAFHVCRATESLMLAYYDFLSGHPWNLPRNRNWDQYIAHLVKEGAPLKITARLNEIKDNDRNAYIHPDKNVTTEEARVIYGLCSGVDQYMADEIAKGKKP
jgi:hypothetical protein